MIRQNKARQDTQDTQDKITQDKIHTTRQDIQGKTQDTDKRDDTKRIKT